MKFIIFVIDTNDNLANPEEMQNIDRFNESLQRNGHWITAAGIKDSKSAKLIDNRAGKNLISEGSLFNAPEFYSGFWIIQTDTEKVAEELALQGSLACNRKVELRPYIQ